MEANINKKIFAQRLKTQRESKGITQKQLSDIIGITERGYQYYESLTDFREPSFSFLSTIVSELDISIDYLFNRTENPKSHMLE